MLLPSIQILAAVAGAFDATPTATATTSAAAGAAATTGATANEPVRTAPSADDVFLRAFGRRSQLLPPFDASLYANGRDIGRVHVEPAADPAQTKIDAKAFTDAVAGELTPEAQASMREAVGTSDKLTVADLRTLGWTVALEPERLSLRADPPLAWRPRVSVFSGRSRAGADRPGIPLAGFSAYVNANLFAEVEDEGSGLERGPLQGLFIAGASARGWQLTTGAAVQENLTDQSDGGGVDVRRLNTKLTRDFPERMLQLEIGDTQTSSLGYATSVGQLGVTFGTNFDLKPLENFQTQARQEFDLDQAATVQVFVNGVQIRTLRLQPGRYSLDDLPIASGVSNDVLILIQTAAGTREIRFNAFRAPSLLREGVSRWNVSAGVERGFAAGDFDYTGDPVLAVSYERGITGALTAGGAARIGDGGGVAAAQAAFAYRGVFFDAQVAASSFDDTGSGYAFDVQMLRSPVAEATGQRPLRASWVVSYRSPEFTSIKPRGTFRNDLSWTTAASVGGALSANLDWQASAGYGVSRDGQDRYDASLSLSYAIGRLATTATVSHERDTTPGREAETTFRVGLSLPFGRRNSFQAAYDSRQNRSSAAVTGRRDLGLTSTLDYRLGGVRDDEQQGVLADVVLTGHRGTLSATSDIEQVVSDEGGAEDARLRTRVTASTAIVFADGRFGLTAPVSGGFVIIDDKALDGRGRIGVNPRPNIDGEVRYQAVSGRFGPAVVSGLRSYMPHRVETEPLTIDDQVLFAVKAFDYRPAADAGAIYVIEGGDLVTLTGQLTVAGQPLALAVGRFESEDGQSAVFFTNRFGRYFVEGLKAGKTYRVVTSDGAFVGRATVDEDLRGLVRDRHLELRPANGATP